MNTNNKHLGELRYDLLAPGHCWYLLPLRGRQTGESHLVPLVHLQQCGGAAHLLPAPPDVDGLDQSLSDLPHLETALVPPSVRAPCQGQGQLGACLC